MPLYQEQLTGAEYNGKSDVWSLGCILYELCSLRPPFHAESHLELVTKVTSGQLPRIPQHYTDDLFALVSSLLQVAVSYIPLCTLFLFHLNSTAHNLNHCSTSFFWCYSEMEMLGVSICKCQMAFLSHSDRR